MPELPEVETVRRGLAQTLPGATLCRVELYRANLRFPFPEDFARRLTGRRIEAVGRRAKYLMIDLDDGLVLAAHLGMTGSFRIAPPDTIPSRLAEGGLSGEAVSAAADLAAVDPSAAPIVPGRYYHARQGAVAHDHVRFELDSGVVITYNDPRRFGFMTLVPRAEVDAHALFRAIGVEPLGEAFDARLLARLMAGKTTPLKAALLDQKLIAGLGNIYVCEALHRAGLSPRRAAGTLARSNGAPTAAAVRLAAMIRDVLNEAVEAGGSSLRDYRHIDGTLGTFQHGFKAYDREGEPCLRLQCRGTIERIVQAGRSTFYCATCQG